MAIKPPTFNYGGSGGAMFGLIAQAMANKYRETPIQMASRQRTQQKRAQRFQAGEAEKQREATALSQVRAFDLGMQEAIARGQVLTPDLADSDPALRGREVARRRMSVLGLPGMEDIPMERLGGRPTYEILDPNAVAQARREYNPFQGDEYVRAIDLNPMQAEYLRANPQLWDERVAADDSDIAMTVQGIRRMGLDSLAGELEQKVSDGAINYSTLYDYAKRSDFELKARADERAGAQLRIQQDYLRTAQEQWDLAQAMAVDDFTRMVPTAKYGEFVEGGSNDLIVPVDRQVATALLDIHRETQGLGAEEQQAYIVQKQIELGRRDVSLADLYMNHTPLQENPANFVGSGGGMGDIPNINAPYDGWLIQSTENRDDWLNDNTNSNWLRQLVGKIQQDPDLYSSLRALGPSLPEDRGDLDVARLKAAIQNDPSGHLLAGFMAASGSNGIAGWGSRNDLSMAISIGFANPYENYDQVPTPQALSIYRDIMRADGRLTVEQWGDDPEGFFNRMISNAAKFHGRMSGGPTTTLNAEGEQEFAEAGSELQRAMEPVDVGAGQNIVQELIRNGDIAQGFLQTSNPNWTVNQQTGFHFGKMGVVLNNLDESRGRQYEEILKIIANAKGHEDDAVAEALGNMIKYLPTENTDAGVTLSEWVQKALDIYERTGQMDYLETHIGPAAMVALEIMRSGKPDPVWGENKYQIRLKNDAAARNRGYGGAAPASILGSKGIF